MLLFLFILLALLLTGYAVLLMFYRRAWVHIPGESFPAQTASAKTRISVIVPARNEASNIGRLLASLSKQQYPSNLFEVLVIDDHSTDETAAIIGDWVHRVTFSLRVISLQQALAGEPVNSYKKKAIETGIVQSKSELIVTTDADCYVQPQWLSSIASVYEKNRPAIIVMPVCVDCSMRFIEIFQALDFMTLQGVTGAGIQQKVHSMCNGANLAYTREAFDRVNGFAGIDHIASGDDLLLLHKIKNKYPAHVHYLKSKDVIVYTQPVVSVGAFFQQRIRWASKTGHYEDKSLFPVLLMVYLLNFFFLVVPLVFIFTGTTVRLFNHGHDAVCIWLLLLCTKTVIELFFLYPVAAFFNRQQLLWLFPLMQPFHILYTVIAGFLGKLGSYRWKERKVK